jgi:hypothetical protein
MKTLADALAKTLTRSQRNTLRLLLTEGNIPTLRRALGLPKERGADAYNVVSTKTPEVIAAHAPSVRGLPARSGIQHFTAL